MEALTLDPSQPKDVIVAVLLVVGCLMSLGAGYGLLRFPEILTRMHAATKPQVLGLLCLLLAVAIQLGQWVMVPLLALIWVFQLLTAPVSAHMVGRAAYRSRHLEEKAALVQDDLATVVRAAQEAEDEAEAARTLAETGADGNEVDAMAEFIAREHLDPHAGREPEA